MFELKTWGLFVVTAIAEIVGCVGAVTVLAPNRLLAAQALVIEDLPNTNEPLQLWDAVAQRVSDRSTLRLRWMFPGAALFEGPVVDVSEGMRVRSLYPCRVDSARWTCRGPDEELQVEAHGMQHVIHVIGVERAVALRLVEYTYSACFEAQRDNLKYKGPGMIRYSHRPISRISSAGAGAFRVDATGVGGGLIFDIEAAAAGDGNGCEFRLIRIGGRIVMRPDTARSLLRLS